MKTLKFLSMTTLMVLLFFSGVQAAVTGDCSNCHTMHNSQQGSAVTPDSVPQKNLLLTNCIGCHSNSSNSDTIVELGAGIKSKVPIVFNPGGALQYPADGSKNSALAGGNFYWVTLDDSFGHNVAGIVPLDADLQEAPGNTVTCITCHYKLTMFDGGDGCRSCHIPAHHYDDGIDGPAGEGDGWYRFLGSRLGWIYNGQNDKVALQVYAPKGIESPDWEQNPSESNHNVYYATPDSTASQELRYNRIDRKCSGCHSDFHHKASDTAGAWIRHPTDVVIPKSGEYAGYTKYDPLVPVGVPDLAIGVQGTVRPGTDLVTCLSCHRAHASPYPDMLRWDYVNECKTGASSENSCGCFTCHTTKDGI